MSLRSRYSETDKMGVVYHSRFLEYFEVIRTEFIREAGLAYSEMEQSGVMLPVSRAEVRYLHPVRYDELMECRLSIYEEPVVRLVTWYDIRVSGRADANVLGKVELVFVNMKTGRPVRAPREFVDKINDYAELA